MFHFLVKLIQEVKRIFELVFNFSVLSTSVIGAIYRAIMNQRFNEILWGFENVK